MSSEPTNLLRPKLSTRSSLYDAYSGPGKTPFCIGAGGAPEATQLGQLFEQLQHNTPLMSGKEDTDATTYVFIFTNPRSGNQQGKNLMNLGLQNFRLRERPSVQIQIYDITQESSRKDGLHYLHQLQLRQGEGLVRLAFPELVLDREREGKGWEERIAGCKERLAVVGEFSEAEVAERLARAQERCLRLHVWSAGGDGTVSATIQAMIDYGIDVGRVFFSCIPFGTGNDFADALGWGRSVPGDGVGDHMRILGRIISERLDGYTGKLDIYEIAFTTYDGGHVKHVEKKMFSKPGQRRHSRLMIDYFSLGVQGFVGSSFELHRPGRRALNILMYTAAAAKWVFLKRFPPITEALESISTVPDRVMEDRQMSDADRARWLEEANEDERRQVLVADSSGKGGVPAIRGAPIEIDVQNVSRFWGRDIDVWGSARDSDSVQGAVGPCDSRQWTPQYAGDGKVELFSVQNIADYALNQLPNRSTYRIGRMAQMSSPVALHFRDPQHYPRRGHGFYGSRRPIRPGLLYAMCDGEFIELYKPRDIIVSRKVTLKAVGHSPESSRIVRDTMGNDGLDAVQMDATAAASRTRAGEPPDLASYLALPFQRIFRKNAGRESPVSDDSLISQTGSVLEVESPGSSQAGGRKSTLVGSLRSSLLRSLGHQSPSGSRSSSRRTTMSRKTDLELRDNPVGRLQSRSMECVSSSKEGGRRRGKTVVSDTEEEANQHCLLTLGKDLVDTLDR